MYRKKLALLSPPERICRSAQITVALRPRQQRELKGKSQ
jgi:hypothetical protein